MRHADFERLYAEHAKPLLGFLAFRTGDQPLAEDLLADTFERVLSARRPFDRRKASEKTWLYTIALNLLRDHLRHAEAGSRALGRVEAVFNQASSSAFDEIDERDALRRAMENLSADEFEAIAMRYGADLAMPEIAKLTGTKLTTVEGRVYRALRKLKDELG